MVTSVRATKREQNFCTTTCCSGYEIGENVSDFLFPLAFKLFFVRGEIFL